MALTSEDRPPANKTRFDALSLRLMEEVANPSVQERLRRLPILRAVLRRKTDALFDLVAGFAHSQILQAALELNLLDALAEGPATGAHLSRVLALPEDRIILLADAAAALGLLKRRRGRYYLAPLGAAARGVPGLRDMVSHHRLLYRDLEDFSALLTSPDTPTEMEAFWAYVIGDSAAKVDAQSSASYSRLMTATQAAVSSATLTALPFRPEGTWLDVGGGRGAFAQALKARHPALTVSFMDLAVVVEGVLHPEIETLAGNFRTDGIAGSWDTISLIRILFDHRDETVIELLTSCRNALKDGGRLLISEPMRGENQPSRIGDAYYALYTFAMKTGKTRSPEEIINLLKRSGFTDFHLCKDDRPETTRSLVARVV